MGKLTLTEQHDPAAQKELSQWYDECTKLEGFQGVPGLSVGLAARTRDDFFSYSNSTDLQPRGNAHYVEQSIEAIVFGNEFVSIGTYLTPNSSVTGRWRHKGFSNNYLSGLLSVISTQPPELKAQIEQSMKRQEPEPAELAGCQFESGPQQKTVAYATFVLKDGTSVKGIASRTRHVLNDYRCGVRRRNESELDRQQLLAERAVEESISFYSKELVNPFHAACFAQPSLLQVTKVRDVSGDRGLLYLFKSETLSLGRP